MIKMKKNYQSCHEVQKMFLWIETNYVINHASKQIVSRKNFKFMRESTKYLFPWRLYIWHLTPGFILLLKWVRCSASKKEGVWVKIIKLIVFTFSLQTFADFLSSTEGISNVTSWPQTTILTFSHSFSLSLTSFQYSNTDIWITDDKYALSQALIAY